MAMPKASRVQIMNGDAEGEHEALLIISFKMAGLKAVGGLVKGGAPAGPA